MASTKSVGLSGSSNVELSDTVWVATLVGLGLGACGWWMGFFFNRPEGVEGLFNRVVLGAHGSLFLLYVGVVFSWPRAFRPVIMLALGEVTLHLVARLAASLFYFQGETDPRPFVALYMVWSPVLILTSFVILSNRSATLISGTYIAACLGVVIAYMASNLEMAQRSDIRAFLLQHYLLANCTFLAMSLILSRIKASQASAWARARHSEIQAHTDPLTGLPNRRDITDHLQARLQLRATTVMMCDVDHFKSINDTHGHLAGDKVLWQIAQLFKQHLRDNDIVGRWGGEEFLILVDSEKPEVSAQLCSRLLNAVRSHQFPNPGTVTVSIGCAINKRGEAPDTALQRADTALYQAKNGGRDRFVVGPTSHE